jgi:hypothetical protein
MSAFDALDQMMIATAGALFGDRATVHPMKPGPGGVNAAPVEDLSRAPLTDITVIRSEWSERVQIGGNGLPTPAGAFKQAAAAQRHIATLQKSELVWLPRKGDEIEWNDRPGTRYRLTEPMPDGGDGLHFGASKV